MKPGAVGFLYVLGLAVCVLLVVWLYEPREPQHHQLFPGREYTKCVPYDGGPHMWCEVLPER